MSSNLIGWIVTLVFVVMLAVGFLIGLWRGLKRSTVSLVMSVVGVLLAFFITPIITDAILGISVTIDGTKTTLEALLVTMLTESEEMADLISSNENIEIILLNIPRAMLNAVVFILVTVAVEFILYIIFKILALTCFRIKEDEKKHGLAGGFVGLFKTFVVMLLAFMPLAGLTGMANNLLSTTDYGLTATVSEEKTQSLVDENLPKSVKNIVIGLEDNMLMKMCGIFGLDNAMFDYYSSFEVENEKLYVREEVNNIYQVADLTYQLTKTDFENLNYVTVRYDKVSNLVNNISKSTLYKNIIAPTLADVIINYEDYDFIDDMDLSIEVTDTLDDIGKDLKQYVSENKTHEYFKNDIDKIINTLKILGQSGLINDAILLNDVSIDSVSSLISKENNANAVSNAISSIFDINMVRCSTDTLVNYGIEYLSSDVDEISATTKNWTDEDWEEFKTSLSNIVLDFGEISQKVDVVEVVEDATVLLDTNKNYDIDRVTHLLGKMLDEIRANKLLKTSDNKSIIDDLLEENDLSLPKNDVKNIEGTWVAVDNYSKYFEFITPSLKLLRDEGVYDVLDDSSLSSSQMMIKLATILSKEGNDDLLSRIILPLYQVEPTKTIIIEELTDNLQSDLVDFSSLSSYDAWDQDLAYLSDMLITLNSIESGDETLLTMALDEDFDGLIDSLNEDNIESVLYPILYAKSTKNLREDLFETIKQQLDNASGANSTLSLTGVTLAEGATEDQAKEICKVVSKLIAVNKALNDGETIKTIDKTILGNLLNTMKTNAYRTQLLGKTETGVFNVAFVDLVNKLKTDYQTEVDFIESQPEIMEELGIESLDENNYPNIDFVNLLAKIAEVEGLI